MISTRPTTNSVFPEKFPPPPNYYEIAPSPPRFLKNEIILYSYKNVFKFTPV